MVTPHPALSTLVPRGEREKRFGADYPGQRSLTRLPRATIRSSLTGFQTMGQTSASYLTSSALELVFDDRCPVAGLIVRRGGYRVSPGIRDQLGCGLANASHRLNHSSR